MLQIHLLGQFDVRADGQRLAIGTRPAQSLFAFLVLNAGKELLRLANMMEESMALRSARMGRTLRRQAATA